MSTVTEKAAITKDEEWQRCLNLLLLFVTAPSSDRVGQTNNDRNGQLENSALDIAASILAALEDVDEADQVAIVSPASPTFDKGGVVDSPAPSAFSEVVAQIL